MSEVNLSEIIAKADSRVEEVYRHLEEIALNNHSKVLQAFHRAKVSEYHLKGSTGYGYGDAGRDAVEKVFAGVFGAEAALVRGQIASGTHAISLCLFGILRPGDELLFVTGRPYDTLEEVIGVRGSAPGNLKEWGISYKQVDLLADGSPDLEGISAAINQNTRVVMIQRSRGYDWRPAINIGQIRKICETVKNSRQDLIIFVDNCYGEFVEKQEPIEVGADLAAGSLIKNMGGGIAPTGGYIVGRQDLVDMAAHRMIAPGIGGEVGASLSFNRSFLQGIFMAPHVVAEALKGAIYAAVLFEILGYEVSPGFAEKRSDIIQAIKFDSAEEMTAFCRGLQKGSPLDGHIVPEPAPMPGYDDMVIMAGGTFVAGSTIELSADGPLREPYTIYMQGGLSKEYIKLGLISAVLECQAIGTKKI